MSTRTYYADAMFLFRLQTGSWPDCDTDFSTVYANLQEALMRTGLEFVYRDTTGDDVAAQATIVTAPVPCGDMPPEPLVPGLVAWAAPVPPRPDQGWALGQALAAWLTAVPVITQGLTFMVDVQELWVRESSSNSPGALWPEPV